MVVIRVLQRRLQGLTSEATAGASFPILNFVSSLFLLTFSAA
jgi:hypothetical protein